MREFKKEARRLEERLNGILNNDSIGINTHIIETGLAEAYEKGVEDAAKIAESMDICSTAKRCCVKEVAEEILNLKPSRKGAE